MRARDPPPTSGRVRIERPCDAVEMDPFLHVYLMKDAPAPSAGGGPKGTRPTGAISGCQGIEEDRSRIRPEALSRSRPSPARTRIRG